MNGTLRIAQITDCHVSAAPDTLYRGQDPVKNLQAVLSHVRSQNPDLVLATGDLSEDGSEDSYRLIKDLFDLVGVPVLALPGNHDDPGLLKEHFPGSPVDDIAVTENGAWQLIRVNSCLPGQPHGRVADQMLAALKKTLGKDPGRPRLLALHHQPLVTNSPWIDKYRLMDAGPFLDLVIGNTDVKAVIWGHIHQPFETKINQTLMLGSPSSVANSLPGTESFTLNDEGPAYRWLELEPDGNISSEVVRAQL